MFDKRLQDGWQESEAGWTMQMPTGWMQGRSTFGGLTAACAVALAMRRRGPDWSLRTMSIQLLRPTVPGPTSGELRVLRDGKGVCFLQVELHQAEGLVAAAHLVLVRPRAGAMQIEGPRVWTGADPETLEDLPYIPGLTPEFIQHVSMRWASGGPPFSGAAQANFTGYCRFNVPASGVEAVVGLLDVWPCPSLSLLSTPVPASTVSWTAHILHVPERFDGWFPFSYETVAGSNGFHTVVGRLHGPDGRLVGWTEQLAVVFA